MTVCLPSQWIKEILKLPGFGLVTPAFVRPNSCWGGIVIPPQTCFGSLNGCCEFSHVGFGKGECTQLWPEKFHLIKHCLKVDPKSRKFIPEEANLFFRMAYFPPGWISAKTILTPPTVLSIHRGRWVVGHSMAMAWLRPPEALNFVGL